MILFLEELVEMTKGATASTTKLNNNILTADRFQQFIDLLEVIAWPLTIFCGLFLFRKQFSKVLNSLGSIKANATGFEMNFIEDKLQEATKLIGIGSSGIISKDSGSIIPKDGGPIIPKDSGSIIPKDSQSVIPKRSHAESPYQELIELQDAINQKLKNIATQNGITASASSNFALTIDLEDHDVIKSHTASKLKTLIELNNIGLNSPKITYDQVTQMKKLFNNISF